jgi:dGTPase
MELADDIAYAIHDLEDAIVMNLVNESLFADEVSEKIKSLAVDGLSEEMASIQSKLFGNIAYQRKNAIGALVNIFITAISIEQKHVFASPILDHVAVLPENAEIALNLFKHFVFKHVIKKPDIQLIEYKGQQIVMSLFEAFCNEPERLLPLNTKNRWETAEDEQAKHRIIADYISGMTDEYANRMYANLFLPKSHNMSDTQQQL